MTEPITHHANKAIEGNGLSLSIICQMYKKNKPIPFERRQIAEMPVSPMFLDYFLEDQVIRIAWAFIAQQNAEKFRQIYSECTWIVGYLIMNIIESGNLAMMKFVDNALTLTYTNTHLESACMSRSIAMASFIHSKNPSLNIHTVIKKWLITLPFEESTVPIMQWMKSIKNVRFYKDDYHPDTVEIAEWLAENAV